jgi:hypothetical protein
LNQSCLKFGKTHAANDDALEGSQAIIWRIGCNCKDEQQPRLQIDYRFDKLRLFELLVLDTGLVIANTEYDTSSLVPAEKFRLHWVVRQDQKDDNA